MATKEIWDLHPSICHYTGFEIVKKILQSKDIWATHFSFLNDMSEIRYSKKQITKTFNKTFRDNPAWPQEEWIDFLFSKIEPYIFIASFCILENNGKLKEDDGILSMWRSYGDDGCFIVFDTKLLLEAIGENVFRVLGKVFYDEHQVEMKYLVSRIAKQAKLYIDNNQMHNDIFTNFFSFITMLKHPGFREEREIRMAVMNEFGDEEQPPAILVQKNEHGKDYIKLPFSSKCIKKIVIGPSKMQRHMYDELKNLCHSQSEYQHVQFGMSEIPYRKEWRIPENQ